MLALAPGCEMDIERGPDWLLVRIREVEADELEGVSVAQELTSLMERHSIHRLVLEMDQVERLTPHWISEIETLYRRIHERGGVLRLCGLSPENRRRVESCSLAAHCHPYCDREEAVLGTHSPRQPR